MRFFVIKLIILCFMLIQSAGLIFLISSIGLSSVALSSDNKNDCPASLMTDAIDDAGTKR